MFTWGFSAFAQLPYVSVKNTQFGVYPFWCKVMCIVYIAYMGTVVMIHVVKISFVRFAHCADSEDKLYTFCTLCLCVLFTFHIYLNTISYQVAAGQITWGWKVHNLVFVNFTFLCHFFFLNRKPLKKAKAEMPQVNKSVALLMIHFQYIYSQTSMAQTPLGPWMGSSSQWRLNMAPGWESNIANSGKSIDLLHNNCMLSVLIRIALKMRF